jgi:hypothetical protein
MEKKTIEVKDYKTVYVAADGTEFDTAEECKKYDKSAVGVLKGRIKKFTIKETTEDGIFNCGSCDNTVMVCIPQTIADLDAIRQLIVCMGSSESYAERLADDNVGRVVFLTISYCNDGAWFTTLDGIIKDATDGKWVAEEAE